jgi:hypothetical protein
MPKPKLNQATRYLLDQIVAVILFLILTPVIVYLLGYVVRLPSLTLAEVVAIFTGAGTLALVIIIPLRFYLLKLSTITEDDKTLFKNRLISEITKIADNDFVVLGHQKWIPNLPKNEGFSRDRINYVEWFRGEEEKMYLLGFSEANIVESFYLRLAERNDYLDTVERSKINDEEIAKLNRSCIDEYNRMLSKVNFLKEGIHIQDTARSMINPDGQHAEFSAKGRGIIGFESAEDQ